MNAADDRREKLRRLSTERFDLVVIGGGINGAGIAREAALRGVRTALVDKGDFASGTSSKSSKLIHGGVRYLEHGNVALVLEASRERDLLRRRLAPHLVRPLPFFFPIYRDGAVGLWKLRAGLLAYDLLAAFRNIRRHQVHRREASFSLEPHLRREDLRGGALYYDCITDDARLVLETVLAAEAAGATCLNYVAVDGFERTRGTITSVHMRDVESGEGAFGVETRVVVNATGPWLDRVRALDDPAATPILRPTKGAHLVVPRERVGNRHAVVLHSITDRRVLFVIPWEEQALVGTTDTDFEGDPDRLVVEAEDVEYLLETVNFYFPEARLTEADVLSTFVGQRPLIAGSAAALPSALSREDAIVESRSGLLSLGGGKLTTYRRVAVKVVDRVARRLERDYGLSSKPNSGTDREPLPGSVGLEEYAAPGENEDRQPDRNLIARYGSRARELLRRIESSPALGRPLAPRTSYVCAEVPFAAETEMAIQIDDVLRRRTQVALRTPDGGAGVAELTATLMAEAAGWDAATVHRRAEDYRRAIAPPAGGEPERRKA